MNLLNFNNRLFLVRMRFALWRLCLRLGKFGLLLTLRNSVSAQDNFFTPHTRSI